MSARRLTICAIGYADSPHVAARTRCFAERGHKVYLISERRSARGIPGVEEKLLPRPTGLGALALRGLRRLGLDVDAPVHLLALRSLLRQCKPDVVHVHFAYSYYGWLAALLGCRPLAVTVMGGDILFDEQGCPSPAGRWLTLELLRQADYITSKADHLTRELDRLGGFGKKAERIVWGISLQRFQRVDASPARERLGLNASQRVVLSPKILQRFYRVHLVVEAMALVVREIPDAVLVIMEFMADAQYREELRAQAARLGLDRHVRFCPAVTHDAMPAYYSLAEATVAVPASDGLPQTLLEGMACETPSIVGRLPRYEEIVTHMQSAYFVDATAESIAEGIVRLLRDAQLARTLSGNALGIVRAQGNLEEQVGRVEKKFFDLARSVERRAWRPMHLLKSLGAYLRAKKGRWQRV